MFVMGRFRVRRLPSSFGNQRDKFLRICRSSAFLVIVEIDIGIAIGVALFA
jgi:hypothetical protein